ncbi:MAG: DUF4407 domain-containing protein [Pedobacter sp.]|nr:MAG: DUF4407 domain-containing protein [Pedobacter sp.]
MNKINRFFWFCAGVHQASLKNHVTEENKYVGIGATIFFTGLFAALSGGYAIYFIFKGATLDWLFAILFGAIWGLAIFNMDRYIVSSISKNNTVWKQVLQALPRILLAVMIGIVISRPLELKIFDKEIKEKLKVTYLNGQRAKIDTLNNIFANKYHMELNKLGELKSQRDSMENYIKSARTNLNHEIFGNKTTETSGQMGYGTYAKMKQGQLLVRESELKTLDSVIRSQEAFINERKVKEGLLDQKLYSNDQLDSLTNLAGFKDRNWALGQLSQNPDGSKDENTARAIAFIALLFIFFECLPVFVKLMSNMGPYDKRIAQMEDVEIYESGRDTDLGKEVVEDIYEAKKTTAVEKRKRQLRADL